MVKARTRHIRKEATNSRQSWYANEHHEVRFVRDEMKKAQSEGYSSDG